MKYTLALSTLALAMAFSSQAQAAKFVEGKDYRVVDNPDKITGKAIIVREFFWYGCSHCHSFEPIIKKWKKKKPKDVAFFSTPAVMNPVWENSARAFYAAQMMGYQKKTHDKLFKTIFRDPNNINQSLSGRNKQALITWYASQGLDKKQFASTMESFGVNAKVTRSQKAAMKYKLTGTPAVVVQGKYVITASQNQTPAVIDFLVNKVRKEKKGKK